MTEDRRTLFATGDVAHLSLRDSLARPNYAEATPRSVIRSVADICAAPGGARDRQVLYGQPVHVLTENAGWSFVRAQRDGYVGWVDSQALGDPVDTTFRVITPATHLYPSPNLKSIEIRWLSFGSELRIVAGTDGWLETHDGFFVPQSHLRALLKPMPDYVTAAQLHFGVPYLWGGNSSAGIDCSGLVQAALRAAGHDCPGDSDQQAALLGQTLADEPPERGDLYFWKGHVAITVDHETLIHANGHHMAVTYEKLDDAIERIAQAEGPVTRRARLPPLGRSKNAGT